MISPPMHGCTGCIAPCHHLPCQSMPYFTRFNGAASLGETSRHKIRATDVSTGNSTFNKLSRSWDKSHLQTFGIWKPCNPLMDPTPKRSNIAWLYGSFQETAVHNNESKYFGADRRTRITFWFAHIVLEIGYNHPKISRLSSHHRNIYCFLYWFLSLTFWRHWFSTVYSWRERINGNIRSSSIRGPPCTHLQAQPPTSQVVNSSPNSTVQRLLEYGTSNLANP